MSCPVEYCSAEFGLWTFHLVLEGVLACWTSLQLTKGMGFRTDGTLDRLPLLSMSHFLLSTEDTVPRDIIPLQISEGYNKNSTGPTINSHSTNESNFFSVLFLMMFFILGDLLSVLF